MTKTFSPHPPFDIQDLIFSDNRIPKRSTHCDDLVSAREEVSNPDTVRTLRGPEPGASVYRFFPFMSHPTYLVLYSQYQLQSPDIA